MPELLMALAKTIRPYWARLNVRPKHHVIDLGCGVAELRKNRQDDMVRI